MLQQTISNWLNSHNTGVPNFRSFALKQLPILQYGRPIQLDGMG